MSAIEVITQTVYRSPTKGRRYLTAKAAADAEARALLDRKYPKENTEYENGREIYGGWHWSSDVRLVATYERLARLILKRLRRSTKLKVRTA